MELIKDGKWNLSEFMGDTTIQELIGFDHSGKAIECLQYIPESFTNDATERVLQTRLGFILQDVGMYCNLAWDWIRPLADLMSGSRVLEVMSGRGWLSLTLDSLGVDIIATDDFSWSAKAEPDFEPFKSLDDKLFPTIKLDACAAIEKYGKDVEYVILGWPPHGENSASMVVDAIRRVNPNIKLIYCGEDFPGCTAESTFFEKVKFIDIPKVTEKYVARTGWHDFIRFAVPADAYIQTENN